LSVLVFGPGSVVLERAVAISKNPGPKTGDLLPNNTD
jgi:hypothetical protein